MPLGIILYINQAFHKILKELFRHSKLIFILCVKRKVIYNIAYVQNDSRAVSARVRSQDRTRFCLVEKLRLLRLGFHYLTYFFKD